MPREAILRDYPEVISVKQIADRVHSFSFGKHFASAGRRKVALLGIQARHLVDGTGAAMSDDRHGADLLGVPLRPSFVRCALR